MEVDATAIPPTLTLEQSPVDQSPESKSIDLPTNQPEVSILARILGVVVLLAILFSSGMFLRIHFAPAISEPDANGYWAQASLLMNTGKTWFKPESDSQYIGMHWLLTSTGPDGFYISRYPPGLAVLIGLVYSLAGYKASVMVNPVLSLFTITGMYFLGRRLMNPWWAIVGVLFLIINQTFVAHALENDSHMAVAACVVWGFYLLLSWAKDGKLWQIAASGLVLGCIPTVRYPDAIIAFAVLVFMLAQYKSKPKFAKHILAATVGALIPIVPLLIRNQMVMGAFWRTGYSLTNEQTGFSWEYFKTNWLGYVQNLNGDGAGLLFALGVIGATVMLFRKSTIAIGLLLSLSAVPIVLLYMSYYWAPQGNSSATLRFLLPIIPCFILSGTWLLSDLSKSQVWGVKVIVPLVAIGLQFAMSFDDIMARTSRSKAEKDKLVVITDALDSVTSKGDVVVSQNQLLQHLDFVRHWKLANVSLLNGGGGMGGGRGGGFGRGMGGGGGVGAVPGADQQNQPSPMQREKEEILRKKYAGNNSRNQFAVDVKTWAEGKSVYYVGPESGMYSTLGLNSYNKELEIVKRIALPQPPEDTTQQGRGRGFGGGMGGPPGGGGGFGGPPGGGFGGGMGGGRRGGGGGGPMGPAFQGEKEIVIARWTIPSEKSETPIKTSQSN